MKEVIVGKLEDFKDNEMKTVALDDSDDKVLISRIDGEFFAVSAFCTHYGAPLEKGILSDGRIVCPWHHACFNAKTGDLMEPPALDALVSYELKTQGDNLVLMLPEEFKGRRKPEMSKAEPSIDKRTFIIIGAGAAGYAAAQALRENGYKGRIIMISRENKLPYDRPNLSKEYLSGEAKEEWMPLRSEDFYDEYGIETVLGRKVVRLDGSTNTVRLDDGTELEYDKVLVATGGSARKLDAPGSGLENIFTLRSFSDADRIIDSAEKISRAAVIGASFIGMETAHNLTERGISVTVIGRESVPFEKVFGAEIGGMFKTEHENNGVTFKLERKVSEFKGNGKVERVILDNGDEVEAELVIVGIGVEPVTDFIQGLELDPDGGIKVDEAYRAAKNIYAAGDIASYPDMETGKHVRIEHWRTAEQEGIHAAVNMLENGIPSILVPFFWTAQAGLNFRYVGHAESWDYLITWGNVSNKDFITFFVSEGKVLAAGGNKRDREMAAIEELLRLGKMPNPDKLKNTSLNLLKLINK
ncbi:MAG: FAD-dependent oxidoreductase [Deltaproteobacteria bacterium]